MAAVLKLLALAASAFGWMAIALGTFFAAWFGWNFGGWVMKPHRHGDMHWGVVACIFYAAPGLVLLGSGAVLLLIGHVLA